jgi:hypothetical protein
MNRALLPVDDEESILHALPRLFHSLGYTPVTANGGGPNDAVEEVDSWLHSAVSQME